jgi:hypothetical protein
MTALDFPNDPINGQFYQGYVYNETRNVWNKTFSSGATIGSLDDVFIYDPGANDSLFYNNITASWENAPGVRPDGNGNIPVEFFGELAGEVSEEFNTLEKIENYIVDNVALASQVPALHVDSTSGWLESYDFVPEVGSLNIETTSPGLFKIKVGDGESTWNELPYVPDIASVNSQISAAITTKANLDSPIFTGNVSLPSTTSIGDVSSTEIGYLDGVTSGIQTQISAKLDATTASSTYAPINNPSFTGTVSGISKSDVGLGNVDNTSDNNKPVSSAQQAALDLKLSLSGGTMTGKITLDSDPTQALHAVTKQYVDNVEAGLITRPQTQAATTENLDATYSNGTLGAGATLTANSNGAFPLIDGVQLTTVNGNRGLLVKNQTSPAHNGRYNLTTQGDENTPWVLTRCGLCDEADEIPGSYIFVVSGTINGQTGWVQYVTDPSTFVVGTDAISVLQFSGAGTVVAGSNIIVSGNQVSLIDTPEVVGIEFTDAIQTRAGVPSISEFTQKTASYELDDLNLRDGIIEINSSSATTLTIPLDSSIDYPVGSSIDVIQTGTGTVTIEGELGVTVNATPGLILRTQWSSATLLKRASNTWLVYGDLKS